MPYYPPRKRSIEKVVELLKKISPKAAPKGYIQQETGISPWIIVEICEKVLNDKIETIETDRTKYYRWRENATL